MQTPSCRLAQSGPTAPQSTQTALPGTCRKSSSVLMPLPLGGSAVKGAGRAPLAEGARGILGSEVTDPSFTVGSPSPARAAARPPPSGPSLNARDETSRLLVREWVGRVGCLGSWVLLSAPPSRQAITDWMACIHSWAAVALSACSVSSFSGLTTLHVDQREKWYNEDDNSPANRHGVESR